MSRSTAGGGPPADRLWTAENRTGFTPSRGDPQDPRYSLDLKLNPLDCER